MMIDNNKILTGRLLCIVQSVAFSNTVHVTFHLFIHSSKQKNINIYNCHTKLTSETCVKNAYLNDQSKWNTPNFYLIRKLKLNLETRIFQQPKVNLRKASLSQTDIPPPRQPSGIVLASSAGGPGFNPQSRTAS